MRELVGKGVARIDGVEKVSGKSQFTADLSMPGLLWGLTLRSPVPHARILHVDASRAGKLPGVRAVLTGSDFPGVLIGRQIRDLPLLAYEKVRFVGEKVAAVAAEDRDIAEEALSLIEIDYEELPAVFDPLEAMREGAPIIHENPAVYAGSLPGMPKIPNLLSLTGRVKGNPDLGLKESDMVFEHTFRTPFVHQAYLEPHACVVAIDNEGKVHVWASNKSPFLLRGQVAAGLRIPVSDVIVHLQPVGGDFGGKGSQMDVPLCCCLAKASGCPVKMVMSYTEELMAANPRHPSVISLHTGVKKNGELCSVKVKAVFNSGAYGAFKPVADLSLAGTRTAGGFAYRIPHIGIDTYVVYTNNVPCGHMRGPGYPQIAFAVESQMDIIARAMGIDPIEFRMRNLVEEGDESPFGGHWEGIRAKETLRRAVEVSGWGNSKPRPFVGRGVAVIQEGTGVSLSGASIVINSSGQVTLRMGIPEQGSGSHTILKQIIAQELQVPLDLVSVEAGDTSAVPDSGLGAGASSVTNSMGQAVFLAVRKVRDQLLRDGAEYLGVPEKRISLENGNFVLWKETELEQIPFQELLPGLVANQKKAYDVTVIYDPAAARKGEFSLSESTSFCAQVAEVEVDPETGQVSITKITTAHDVGTIFNPVTHQGQIEGGIVQGVGWSVMEELRAENGRVLTVHLGDYRVPSIKDIPELNTVLLQEPGGPTPYQGKAIGEVSIVPVAAAVANAVCDATGVRLYELPLSAENIYRAMKEKRRSNVNGS